MPNSTSAKSWMTATRPNSPAAIEGCGIRCHGSTSSEAVAARTSATSQRSPSPSPRPDHQMMILRGGITASMLGRPGLLASSTWVPLGTLSQPRVGGDATGRRPSGGSQRDHAGHLCLHRLSGTTAHGKGKYVRETVTSRMGRGAALPEAVRSDFCVSICASYRYVSVIRMPAIPGLKAVVSHVLIWWGARTGDVRASARTSPV